MSASETITQQPGTYQPCYSPQWFTASSTQYAQNGFAYKVKCTDVITAETLTYQIEKRPSDDLMIFDASNFAKNYIKHYVPNNVYGWRVCTDAIRQIKVNVDYTTDAYNPTYASGYDINYYVWNGVEKWLDFPNYTQTDYVYTNSVPFVYLFNGTAESGYIMPRGKTFEDKSMFLYFLGDTTNTFETLRVKTYDSSGTILGTSDIANSYYNSSDYKEKFLCIDVGYKGLSNIASGSVTGTYPIITASVAYYELYDVNTSAGTPPAGTEQPIRRIDISCEPIYTPYVLHYLDRKGNFETINFSKVSEETIQADKSFYRQNTYQMVANQWVYDVFDSNEIALNSSTTTKLKLNSDWLTEDEIEAHKYLISSPRVYIDMGSTVGLLPVKVNNNSYLVNKKFNNKLYSLTIDIDYTYVENLQNG